jgi:hypothetical protein
MHRNRTWQIDPTELRSQRNRILPIEGGDGSTLSLDFTAMGGVIDPRITFSRVDANARATFFNSSGIVTTVASAQAPRFDFDPTTLVAKGLLLEAPATNTVTHSGDFTQNSAGNWSGRTGLITTGSPPWTNFSSPDGGTAAVKLIADTPSTRHSIENNAPSITSGTTYTASAFVKASGYTVANLTVAGGQARRNFTLSGAGSVGSSFGVTNTATINAVGSDGWYRITMTWTATASGATGVWVAIPQNATTDSVTSWAGNGTSGIFAWGAQLEVGTQASSYIATTTGSVTRAVDTAIIAAGTNFSSWYKGGTTGTFVANWHGSASSATSRTVIATSDVDDKHLHLQQTASALTLRLADFGALATVTTANNLTANTLTKGAFSYSGTAASLCLNGGTVATGTLGFSVAPTFLSIGGPSTTGTTITDTSVMLKNSIRTIKYFPTSLSNVQLQALTS